MAENNVIISAEEEAKLLKPIDEYVGKIQAQIDALRVEGSDKVNSLKNQIAIAKENKNLTKEQQNKIIEESKKQLEKAKATEDANKEQITKLIADAEGYLSKHYSSEYYDIVVKSCEAEKKAENSSFEKTKTQLQEEHKKAAKEPEGDTQTAESSEKTAKEETPVNVLVDITKLFVFKNLDEVTRLAHILNSFYAGANDLYKSQTANRYYLLVSKSDQSPETFNKVCNILSEYAAQQPYTPATGAFFREHYHMILQGNALKTLAEL